MFASLTGCGFKLRGSTAELTVKELQLQTQANSYIAADVRRQLVLKNVRLSTDPNAALPRAAITDEVRERSVLTTNTNGRVREFQLKHSLVLQVWDGQGNVWLEPVKYQQSRVLTYDENKLLAKEMEEQALFAEMQAELLTSVMRRLEALNKIPSVSP